MKHQYLYDMDNIPQLQSSAFIMWSNLSRYYTAMTVAQIELDLRITTDTPYLALTGKLWDVYCEVFGENWLRYNSTILYS